MKPYTLFPAVYDYLMRHVDYEYWYRYIRSIMLQYVECPEILLEIGCGTGRFGAKFSRDNHLIYGMDKSIEMLRIAKIRSFKKFRIFCADMTNFQLAVKFDFVYSVHDTMNYLLAEKDIRNTFRSVKNLLHDTSIFMFDLTTEYNIYKNFAQQVSKYTVNNMNVEWSNEYDSEKKLVYSSLEFIHQSGNTDTEMHIQRIYTIEEIKTIIREEGFTIIDIFSDYSFSPVHSDTVMINFITRKNT